MLYGSVNCAMVHQGVTALIAQPLRSADGLMRRVLFDLSVISNVKNMRGTMCLFVSL